MINVTKEDLQNLYIPPKNSHKGQNGKLLIIGGSALFHAASLWSLKVASRIVDLVHYSSTEENNRLVYELKKEFRDGIVVAREKIEEYINEDDCILIGPGMTRSEETETLTNSLLKKYPHKQWVIDAGALQMMELTLIPKNAILTPHQEEFSRLLNKDAKFKIFEAEKNLSDLVKQFSQKYNCVILLKGEKDIVCHNNKCSLIKGGNSGMTKGGTGDVLAGLIAALACKNDPYLATIAGSFINKKSGDKLFQKVGFYFNASDLADQIPETLKEFRGI